MMTHHIPSIVSQRGSGYLSRDAFYEVSTSRDPNHKLIRVLTLHPIRSIALFSQRSSTLRPSFKSTIIFGRCQSDSPTCTRNSRQCTYSRFLRLFLTDSLTMAQAYPQRRPQEDPRVPLPWYVMGTLVDGPCDFTTLRLVTCVQIH